MAYNAFSAVELDPLIADFARRIREAYCVMQEAESNALGRKLDFGDLLNEAQDRIAPPNWKDWLRENLKNLPGFSVSSAQYCQQLARHRDEIEAEIARGGKLSMRAALRLISKKSDPEETSTAEKTPTAATEEAAVEAEDTALDPAVMRMLAELQKLSDVQVSEVFWNYGFEEFYRGIPGPYRCELADRIAGLTRSKDGNKFVLLRQSEILRQALSLVRIAGRPGAAPEDVKHAEMQALAGLRALAKALASVDIDRTTLVDQYAKENRCAKEKRRAA